MDLTDDALILKVLGLAFLMLLCNVDSGLRLGYPRFRDRLIQKIFIIPELPLSESVVSDELLLHVYITHDVRAIVTVLVDFNF